MITAPISLQDLRKRMYAVAKADKHHRFWGLYVHICKEETLQEAYRLARQNNGAPGIDGVTFEMIERSGVEQFLAGIREELLSETYLPMRNRRKEIPSNGKRRMLGIPCIRDRVVEGALKLILEPIFEADFQEGSYGYRPGKKAHEAVDRVSSAVVRNKTRVIDLDLKAYFDTITHALLLQKVARRVADDKVLRLLKLILTANGKRGVPQGGVASPLLANIYLNEVDAMLESMKRQTSRSGFTYVEYARYADDLVVLVDGYGGKWEWLLKETYGKLLEELACIDVKVSTEKTKLVDLTKGETFRCSRQRLSFLLVKDQLRHLTSQPDSIPDWRGGNESSASSGVKAPGCCVVQYRTVRGASKLEGHNIKECLPCRKSPSPEAVGEIVRIAESSLNRTKADVAREELVTSTWRAAGIEGMALQERRTE